MRSNQVCGEVSALYFKSPVETEAGIVHRKTWFLSSLSVWWRKGQFYSSVIKEWLCDFKPSCYGTFYSCQLLDKYYQMHIISACYYGYSWKGDLVTGLQNSFWHDGWLMRWKRKIRIVWSQRIVDSLHIMKDVQPSSSFQSILSH